MSLAIAKGLVLPEGSRFSIGAVPAAIAGVAPTLDFRPALERRETEAVSLTDKLTFTGGNQGTFVGSDGYIQRAQTNVPRFTHDPLTRRSLGMRLEASGQNLLLQSQNFSTTWTLNAVTIGNKILAPDGTVDAQKINETSATAEHRVSQVSSGGATTSAVCASFFAKAAERTKIMIAFSGFANWSGGGGSAVIYDLTAGTASANNSTPTAFELNPYPNDWYHCIVVATPNVLITPVVNIFLYTTASNYAGVAGNGAYLYGAQLNPAPLTSYIKTEASAVTRSADSAVIDGAGVITGTYTLVEKPEGCAVISGTNINLQNGFTVERVMVFPATLTAGQITAIRAAM